MPRYNNTRKFYKSKEWEQYKALVIGEIRKKYSQNDENAILRKSYRD